MEKISLLAFAICVLLLFQILSKDKIDSNMESELLLSNVEALADGESNVGYMCVSTGTVYCPIFGNRVGWVVERSKGW